jgi:hypothetical protein
MLVPGQPQRLIAAEVLAVGIALARWLTVTRLAIGSLRRIVTENRHYFVRHLISLQAAILPYFVGGTLLLAGRQSGMYWDCRGDHRIAVRGIVRGVGAFGRDQPMTARVVIRDSFSGYRSEKR